MLIGELLELTKERPLNEIAKDKLTIGERYARNALKAAGCFPISGKRGWHYEGDPSVLERSIYEFAPNKKSNPVNKPVNNPKPKDKPAVKQDPVHKTESQDLFDQLLNPKPDPNSKIQRGFYFDPKVIKALDKNVKSKYKSEFVNAALERVLKEKGLL